MNIMDIEEMNPEEDENIDVQNTQQNLEYVLSHPALFTGRTLVELCSSSSTNILENTQPYLRGCKWSPDGTCCLCVVNNNGVQVMELPRELYEGGVNSNRPIDVLEPVIHVKEAGLVYDFCWYPGMNSTIPESCCWITTLQNAPIQMWDAFDGSLRCSYRGFNAVDEMEPAVSCTFSTDGARIIAGYKKVLRTFNVERPGREFSEHRINSPASCFATNNNLLAMGSWNTSISLFDENEMGTYKSIGKMHGHSGGITHMKFTSDGLKLISGARKDHRLIIWDIRYYRRPLNVLSRVVDTNQRIYFDLSVCDSYLVTGGTNGIVKVWDVNQVNWKEELGALNDKDNVSFQFPLHNDCCNSISLHPCRPILATGSGQHHFTDPTYMDSDSIDNQINDEIEEDAKYFKNPENSLVFWWVGDVPDLKEHIK